MRGFRILESKPIPFRLLVALACFLAAGCANLGPYVWVDDYRQAATADTRYEIVPGDLLNVRVFNQENMSGRVRVRTDGRISVPFLNDVEAAGRSPDELTSTLQAKLKDFINVPVVTVSVEEPVRAQLPVLGEVLRPGMYALEAGTGVLQALAMAGGLTDYAHRDRIFVLRGTSPVTRIRFTFEDLVHAKGRATAFRLRRDDAVVVE